MKKLLFLSIIVLSFHYNQAQSIQNFKVKNSYNSSDRTKMLDILRAKLYEDYRQEFVFVVDQFKVGNGYAWLKAQAERRDGRPMRIPDDGNGVDCCGVEALFKKSNGKWYIVESGAFSSDVWYYGIQNRYPNAPAAIFY